MIIQPIILITTGLTALIIQMLYFLLDDREVNDTARDRQLKKHWHAAGGAIHIWMGYVVGDQYGPEWGMLMGALTWYLFDGFINTYALKREWWYIGETAWIDKAQRWIAKGVHADPRAVSAFLKHAVLILSIIYVISIYL
jgi:hypothetical protein